MQYLKSFELYFVLNKNIERSSWLGTQKMNAQYLIMVCYSIHRLLLKSNIAQKMSAHFYDFKSNYNMEITNMPIPVIVPVLV